MGLNTVLVVVFFGLVALAWMLMRMTVTGYERYEKVYTETAETNLEQLFLFFDTKKVFFINMAALVVLPLLVFFLTSNFLYVLLLIAALFGAPRVAFRVLEKKRRDTINAALPDVLAQIAGGMRSGSTFQIAVETMVDETHGPIAQEFSLVLREQRLGHTLDEALDNLAERVQTEEMDLVVSASQIARSVGGNLSEIFERLSVTLRRKIEMEGKIKALTSQGKLQGILVAMLPFAMIVALYSMEHEAMSAIFQGILGWGFLAVIIVMEILGGFAIHKIISIDV